MGTRPLQLLSFGLAICLDLLALAAIPAQGFVLTNPWWEAVAFHLASMAIMVAYLFLWFPLGYRRKPATLLTLVVGFGAAMPLFAPLFLALMGQLLQRYQHTGLDDSIDFVSIKNHHSRGLPPITNQSHQSILEDLCSKDRERRRRGVLTLRSIDIKQAMPLLQRAARDSDEQVRLLAQAQFSRIVERIEAKIKSLERQRRQRPDDPYSGRVLADFHYHMVHLGLSSDAAETIHLNRSVELINELIRSSCVKTTDWLLKLKCHLRLKQVSQAKLCLSPLKEAGYPQALLHPWEAEIAFLSKDWRGVKKAVSAMATGPSADPKMANIIQSWLPDLATASR